MIFLFFFSFYLDYRSMFVPVALIVHRSVQGSDSYYGDLTHFNKVTFEIDK